MTKKSNIILGIFFAMQIAIIAIRGFNQEAQAKLAKGPLLDPLKQSEITELSIESQENQQSQVVRLTKDDGIWTIPQSKGYPADQQKVKEIVRDLLAMETADLIANSKHHHGTFRVAEDEFERKVGIAGKDSDGTDIKKEIYFGKTGRAGTIHARQGDNDAVVAVRQMSTWKLGTSNDDWLEKEYFKNPEEQIIAFELQRANQSIRAERLNETTWEWVTPEKRIQSDNEKISPILRKLGRTSMDKLLGPKQDHPLPDQDQITVRVELGVAAQEPAQDSSAKNSDPENDNNVEPVRKEYSLEETNVLRLSPKSADKERYMLLRADSAFVVETAKWNVKPLVEWDKSELVGP